MQNKTTFILVMALLLAMPQVRPQSSGSNKEVVAIYMSKNCLQNQELYKNAIYLATELQMKITHNSQKYQAVERSQRFQELLSKASANDLGSGLVDESTAAKVGEQLGAQYVLGVDLIDYGNKTYYAIWKLIDVKTAIVKDGDAKLVQIVDMIKDLTALSEEITKRITGSGGTSSGGKFKICEQCADNMQDLEVFRDAGAMTWQEAKQYCSGLGSGWYLPSKAELNQLYVNKTELGGFSDGGYWSSTESNSSSAWDQGFDYGNQFSYTKSYASRVRCVRRVN